MFKKHSLNFVIITLVFVTAPFVYGQDATIAGPYSSELSGQDSVVYKQNLINGRIWRGTYYHIGGTENLFTDDWLDADLTMNNQFFDKIKLKYDIVNDEIMFPNEKTNTIIVLNKSQVSRFSLNFNRSVYEFVKLNTGDIRVDGYIQLIHDGSNRLFKKWEKRVVVNQSRLTSEFNVEGTLYLEVDDKFYKISNKNNLMSHFKDQKKELKKEIKQAKLNIDIENPQTIASFLELVEKRNNNQ